jgi:UDP-glucuronate 4-epimerase
MRNIFITGGAGFIGSSLADRLLGLGGKVVAIDNFDPFYRAETKRGNLAKAFNHPNFSFVEGDIRDKALIKNVLAAHHIDLVVHLAAKAGVRPSLANPAEYYDVNVNGTLNILETMKELGVKKMVFASSSSVYGNNKRIPFMEEDPVDFPISPYASSKKSGELLCHVFSHLYDMDINCLRFFTVFGPRQRPDLAIYKFTKLISADQPIPFYGDGSTSRDYTYIDDIVDGIVSATLHLDGYEIINLGGSNPVSLGDLVRKIGSLLQKDPILDIRPLQPGDVEVTYGSIEKAKQVLNYMPKVGIDKGLKLFVDWFTQKEVPACPKY